MLISDWSSDVCSSDLTSLDESRYSLAANAQAYGLLRSLTVDALGHGHSAVADAVFAREPERKAIEAVAGDTGTTFTGIWLATEDERRLERVLARTSDASDRSEEHTSELQSLMRISYAVFCLKKKKQRNYT